MPEIKTLPGERPNSEEGGCARRTTERMVACCCPTPRRFRSPQTRSRTLVRTRRLVRLQIAASPQTPLSRELRDQFLGARRERTESRCEVVARGSCCARGGEKEDRGMSSVNYGVVCRGFECIASVFGGRFDDSIALVFSGASSAAFADNSSARVFGIATLCSATSWSLRVVVEDRLGDCNRAAEEDSAAAVDEQRPADSVATESSPAVAATRTAAIDGFWARNGMQEGVECV
ncbi:hypothetical protein B0H13DRAFT_1007810 [Mycena leptocephala]|nr:hypothetical protein B0H13DRAFT_1007810 [Mycena leptocephala]